MKHNKIALIGMMGCGKTTISKALSSKLKLNLYDLDEIFEKENNTKIKDFFKKFKEEKFRLKEQELLLRLSQNENCVLSCGGGIILSKNNRKILFEKDILTIYLKTSSEEIYKRIKNDTTRPLLQVSNPKEEIEKILNNRKEFYNQAKIIINTDNKTPDEIIQEIIEEIWKK